jgi:hypothetical protein
MSEELSHDPHLRAALRHAPDHALAPPAGVSQTILNAARHVHKPARPAATPAPAVRITVAPPRAIAWLRQWFASPRLSGGLATGLVAALGLGLWIDLGREPVIDRAPVEAAKEQRSSEAAPVAQPAPQQRHEASDRAAQIARHVEPSAPELRDGASPAKRSTVESKTERRLEGTARQRPAAPATTVPERQERPATASEAERALAKSKQTETESHAAEAGMPSAAGPSAAPAPTVAAASTNAQKAEGAAPEAQPDAAARSDSRMSLAAGRAAAVAGARVPASEPAFDASTAASPPFTLLRRARGDTASGNARWTWMPPGKAAIVPMDDAAQAWLARLAQASRGRWTDSAERVGAGHAVEVRWWRDDWPQATLRIEADGLRWIEHNGPARHAPLDAVALQRLSGP